MNARQRIVPIRRDYNRFVADETLEDYALRFTAKKARRWSGFQVAQTALGSLSFLALEAIGGTLVLTTGFTNTVAALLVAGLIIFATAAPISVYAARYGVDIDLLTRGAGFGYIGSTVTSLIYASFTFLFFAIEASIMALALNLCFGLPLTIGYLVSALAAIPLVVFGISLISRFQIWTQPIWIVLNLLPLAFIAMKGGAPFEAWTGFAGTSGKAGGFDPALFGFAVGILLALLAQVGEQVDFLRFVPAIEKERRGRWWAAVLGAGAGWIVPGMLKILLGSFLAVLVVGHGIPPEQAGDPTQMYAIAFGYVVPSREGALALMAVFVVISQLKINVTNAYAGSIAWSNFFSRLTHSPSRARGLARLQRRDRAPADGARHRQDHRQHALALCRGGLVLGRGARCRSRGQQAARPVAAGDRVQTRPPLCHQSGRDRCHGGSRSSSAARLMQGSSALRSSPSRLSWRSAPPSPERR